MLLELLNHHEEIFHDILSPLILGRRMHDLMALRAVCKRLAVTIACLDIIIHYFKYRTMLSRMKFKRVLFINEYGELSTFIEANGILFIYRNHIDHPGTLIIYTHIGRSLWHQYPSFPSDINLYNNIYPLNCYYAPSWLFKYIYAGKRITLKTYVTKNVILDEQYYQ